LTPKDELARRARGMILANGEALEQAPRKQKSGTDWKDIGGKIWTSPNTALGLALGGVGYVAGQLNRLRPGDQGDPRVQIRNNAVEFINNPLMSGALTLGNTINYVADPYDGKDAGWQEYIRLNGHPVQQHERAHTIQGQQLGPFYLPSNIAGGLWSLMRKRAWHTPSNWNEAGPMAPNPRPWPSPGGNR